MEVQGQTIPFELFGLTGVPSLKPFGENLLEIGKTLMSIATETEATAESFHREHSELDERQSIFPFQRKRGVKRDRAGGSRTKERNHRSDKTLCGIPDGEVH